LEFNLKESGAISSIAIDATEILLLPVSGGFSFTEISPFSSENLIANLGLRT